ncbi:MAG: hypothetical protein K0Q73_7643 [Paenibacillus sp.]|jgi:hypothetical protein|nr:hypothetical protein [Paenibacillus sp.]
MISEKLEGPAGTNSAENPLYSMLGATKTFTPNSGGLLYNET